MAIDAVPFAARRDRRDPTPGPSPAAGAGRRAAGQARAGIAVLLDDRVLRLVMIVAFSSLLFMSAVWVAELFFVEDVLGRSDVAYGLMFSIWTIGMAIGALVLSRRVAAAAVAGDRAARRRRSRASAWRCRRVWLGYGFFVACAFAGGVAHGVKNVMFRSLIHMRVPERLHGRAFAAFNGLRNSAELAAFAGGGLLVTAIGARGTLAYAGALSALAGLAGLIVLVRRNYGWVSSESGRSAGLLEQLGVGVRVGRRAAAEQHQRLRAAGLKSLCGVPGAISTLSPAATSNRSLAQAHRARPRR